MAVVSAPKCDVDTVTRIIQVTSPPVGGIVTFNIQEDLYSDLKEIWLTNESLRKLSFPIRAVGGDPLPGSKRLGDTYFCNSSWKVRPYESSHRFSVNGNFYSEDGTSPFTPTVGNYNVLMEHQVSSLVDSTVQQLSQIEQASFNNGVYIDVINGEAGTGYSPNTSDPIGTRKHPSNNLVDALSIGTIRSTGDLNILGNITINSGESVASKHIYGEGATLNVTRTLVTLISGCTTSNVHYHDCRVTGVQGGESNYHSCIIDGISNAHCFYYECGFIDGAALGYTIQQSSAVSGGHATYMKDCYSDEGTAIIDRNSARLNMNIDGFHGRIKFINQNHATLSGNVYIHLKGGTITVDASCTSGKFYVSGFGEIINQANGAEVITTAFISEGFNAAKLTIESLRQTHQGFGERWFVDPVNGNDSNPGSSVISPVKTVAKAIANAVDGRGDTIYLLAPGAAAVTIDERIVVNKEDVHIRGPGRGVQFQPSTPNAGDVITIDSNNCSFNGFIVRAPAGSTTDNCITTNGKFARFEKLYLVGTEAGSGNGFLFRGGDYHELIDCESEKNGGSGIKTEDAALASGSPREITVRGGNYYLNKKDGIELTGNPANPINSTRIIRIMGANIHSNSQYGITADANTTRVVISEETLLHDNVLGNINSSSPSLIDMTYERINSVWSHIKALTVSKFLGLK